MGRCHTVQLNFKHKTTIVSGVRNPRGDPVNSDFGGVGGCTGLAGEHANFNRSYQVTHTRRRIRCEGLKPEKLFNSEMF